MSSEVGILTIESLHVWAYIDKKKVEKVVRYARVSIGPNGKKTHQILINDKWTEVDVKDYHAKAEEIRSSLMVKLKQELLSEVKVEAKLPKPKRAEVKKKEPEPKPKVESTVVNNSVLKTKKVGNHVYVVK